MTPGHAAAASSSQETAQAAKPGSERAGEAKPAVKRRDQPTKMTMATFLDRLMIAESGGRDLAKNPRSTALGPFQFIESTFIDIARRHFPKDVENLDQAKLLRLRTDRTFARKAAAALTRDNAAYLAAAGLKPTFPHLRLAFLLGAGDAIKVLKAKPDIPLVRLLSPIVIKANPFMARLTAGGIVVRAAQDISASPQMTAGIQPGTIPPGLNKPQAPRIKVRCNLGLPSCRRWLALEKRKLATKRKRLRLSRRR